MSVGKVEHYKDAEGKWRWRAIAPNGNIVADSAEGYERLEDSHDGAAAAARVLAVDQVSR